MRVSRLLRILLLSVNLILIAALILSNLAHYIDPNSFLIPAFFGLAYLPLIASNVLFLIFWLVMRPKYMLFGALALLASVPHIQKHHSFVSSNATSETGLKVLSHNVRLFDLYNWTNNDATRDKILNFISGIDADVICFQEYFRSDDIHYFNTLDTLLKVQDASEVHEHFTAVMHKGLSRFGIATLSKYPIVHRGHVPLDTAGNNVAIYSDILWDGDTIRVFNVHLASVHVSALEKGIEEHIEQNERQKQWEDVKHLVRKLAGGYKKRASQAKVIQEYVAASPYPTILCGDINDTPGSYAYGRFDEELNDAFIGSGEFLGASYIGFFPSLRIDYIFHSDDLNVSSFQTQHVRLSDHRPLLAQFSK